MRRRFPRLFPKLALVVGGVVVLLGLGLTASFGLASSGGHSSPQYTYPTNPPPPPPPPPGPPPPPAPPPPPPPAAPPPSPVVLKTVRLREAHNASLNAVVLVSPRGLTLYHMTAEKGKKIVCTGACTQFWPPLLIKRGGKPTAGPGLTAKKLGTIRRPDGTYQVTYAGFALYTFAKDKKAGQAKGEGVEKIWFAVGPNGKIVKR